MKKKIGLLLSSRINWGGTFQYNLTMLEALASLPKDRFDKIVFYYDPVWTEYLKTYRVKATMVSDNPDFASEDCDLWIFPSQTQDKWDPEQNLPVLATIHDLMHRYESRFPEVSQNGEYDSREEGYTHICKWAKGILVDSNLGKQHVQESYNVPNDHIFVLPFIPPKYIYKKLVSEEFSTEDFSTKYNLPPKFIFYPAHFWKHKNHGRLISVVGYLINELPDLHLVLVGGPHNGYQKALRMVKNRNLEEHVHFMGYVPDEDIPEFYRRARAMVMPSYFGPTNIPPLEAFVLQCPVAISNVYAIPEQVGDAALLFNPNSVRELASCIRRLWVDDSLCMELVKRGKERAKSWGKKQFNQRLLDIIDNLVT